MIDLEQASIDEKIEMEGGKRAADGERRGGSVPPDRFHLVGNICVEGPADRFSEDGDLVDRPVLGRVHATKCTSPDSL